MTEENKHAQDDGTKDPALPPTGANDNDAADGANSDPDLNAGASITPASAPFNRTSGFIREPDKVVDDATGRTVLMEAVSTGDLVFALRLLKAGANILKPDNQGRSALHYAASKGQAAATELLLDAGAALNARDHALETPLFAALNAPNAALVVELLLRAGADANIDGRDQRLPLHEACSKGDLALVTLLLPPTADLDRPDKDGMTPLHVSAQKGRQAVLELLLFHRADLFAATHHGDTCLHFAARQSPSTDIARLLMATPAVALVNAVNQKGATPLHEAIRAGHEGLALQMIERGAFPNLADEDGMTMLHIAGDKGLLAMAEMLIWAGADVEIRTKKKGHTPLMEALRADKPALVRHLLMHGADPDTPDAEGVTPLMVAASKGRLDFINELLDAGANAALLDKQGRNVLHHATDGTSKETVMRFMHAGAQIDARDQTGRTALLSTLSRHYNTVFAASLIEAGADVNIRDTAGAAPLNVALQLRRLGAATRLINKGANVNYADPATLMTPLHHAAANSLPAEIALLIARGARAGAADKTGKTPLHMAALNGQSVLDVTRHLLGAGADPIAKDASGFAPYDYARANSKDAVVTLFRDHLQKKGVTYTPKPINRYPWGGGFIM